MEILLNYPLEFSIDAFNFCLTVSTKLLRPDIDILKNCRFTINISGICYLINRTLYPISRRLPILNFSPL